MKPPNFAPLYAALYPELAEVARSHGYALAVHGSLARDFDLIAVPWAESVSEPGAVVAELVRDFALTLTSNAKTPRAALLHAVRGVWRVLPRP